MLTRDHRAVAAETAAAIIVLSPLRRPAEGVDNATNADAYSPLSSWRTTRLAAD